MRGLALPRHEQWLCRDGRRFGRTEGTRDRSLRGSVPSGRVQRARLRLSPPRRKRRAAARIARVNEQLADWRHAIDAAARLPEVDPARVAIWGFSLSGGHVFNAAAENPAVAAAIAQTPNADGAAATRNALRHQRPGGLARFTCKAVLDTVRGLIGREPWMVPLAGPPGSVAVLTTPDALDGDRALNPDHRYPTWDQTLAARSAPPLGRYRPGTAAPRVGCPLLVLVCDNDQSALAEPAVAAAGKAPLGELVRMPGGHYEPFLDGHAHAAAVQVDFLNRHLLDNPGVSP